MLPYDIDTTMLNMIYIHTRVHTHTYIYMYNLYYKKHGGEKGATQRTYDISILE